MGQGLVAGAAVVGLIVLLAFSRKPDAAISDVAQADLLGDGSRTPVLVELFTSEGCSSCPPADILLSQLERSQPVSGARIIALSEHVDYWNRLGWTDPYSAPIFTQRQNEYARALMSDDVYTPQMVVDGAAAFVGSNGAKARAAIDEAARSPKAKVSVAQTEAPAGSSSAPFTIRVEDLPEAKSDDRVEVMLAIAQSGLRSNVARGENAGRKLAHDAVVRKLVSLGVISRKDGGIFTAQPVVKIENQWRGGSLSAVVFVQETKSRRVIGAAAIPISGA